MNLDATLDGFAAFLALDPQRLKAYAAEDRLGGFNHDSRLSMFPSGSLWAVEGQTLYALIRALRPRSILELGVHRGASTAHLRTAVRCNEYGVVRSVDMWEGAGDLIPADLAGYGTLTYAHALPYIDALPDNSIEFAFEDLCHGEDEVYDVATALLPKLRAGAVVAHHDSEHPTAGDKIKAGLRRAGVEFLSLRADPSDCGLAVWRNV